MSKKKKKPDNVADNPGILPYGSNVGAPAIKPTNISSWKEEKLISTNHYFKTRFDEIKEDQIEIVKKMTANSSLKIIAQEFLEDILIFTNMKFGGA